MKELNHVVLGKGPFALVKGYLLFAKEHSDNPEGQVDVKSLLIRSYF